MFGPWCQVQGFAGAESLASSCWEASMPEELAMQVFVCCLVHGRVARALWNVPCVVSKVFMF